MTHTHYCPHCKLAYQRLGKDCTFSGYKSRPDILCFRCAAQNLILVNGEVKPREMVKV